MLGKLFGSKGKAAAGKDALSGNEALDKINKVMGDKTTNPLELFTAAAHAKMESEKELRELIDALCNRDPRVRTILDRMYQDNRNVDKIATEGFMFFVSSIKNLADAHANDMKKIVSNLSSKL